MKVQGNRYINNPEMIKNKVEKKTTVPQNIISEDDVKISDSARKLVETARNKVSDFHTMHFYLSVQLWIALKSLVQHQKYLNCPVFYYFLLQATSVLLFGVFLPLPALNMSTAGLLCLHLLLSS